MSLKLVKKLLLLSSAALLPLSVCAQFPGGGFPGGGGGLGGFGGFYWQV